MTPVKSNRLKKQVSCGVIWFSLVPTYIVKVVFRYNGMELLQGFLHHESFESFQNFRPDWPKRRSFGNNNFDLKFCWHHMVNICFKLKVDKQHTCLQFVFLFASEFVV